MKAYYMPVIGLMAGFIFFLVPPQGLVAQEMEGQSSLPATTEQATDNTDATQYSEEASQDIQQSTTTNVEPADASTDKTQEETATPAPAPFKKKMIQVPEQDELPADYTIKLKDLEERVNQLKERIHQSKARLIQLQEVVLHGTISGAKSMIIHRNELGSSFRIIRVQYSLDGAPIYNRADQEGDLDKEEEIVIFDGSIVPGNHQLSVYMVLAGNGFGIFSYLNNYRFKIKSSYTFNAEEGKLTTVKIVGFEKGDVTTELAERPSVRYDVERKRALRTEGVAPETQPQSTENKNPAQ